MRCYFHNTDGVGPAVPGRRVFVGTARVADSGSDPGSGSGTSSNPGGTPPPRVQPKGLRPLVGRVTISWTARRARPQQPSDVSTTTPPSAPNSTPPTDQRPRLTMLVSGCDWRHAHVAEQLPRLLQPLGIQCVAARSSDETTQLLRTIRIHIAVVDLSIPLKSAPPRLAQELAHELRDGNDPATGLGAGVGTGSVEGAMMAQASGPEAGCRVLDLLRRLENPPPTIVIRPPQPSLRDSARTLTEALNAGAFAVLDRPVQLEAMLDALRRLVRRHYADHWPAA